MQANTSYSSPDVKSVINRGDYSSLDIVRVFQSLDLYLKPTAEAGKHNVTCPWAHAHGETGPTDTVIWESRGDAWPEFLCSHNHCDGQRIQAVIDLVNGQHPGLIDSHCSQLFGGSSGIRHQLAEPSPAKAKLKTYQPTGERMELPEPMPTTPAFYLKAIFADDEIVSIERKDGGRWEGKILTVKEWRDNWSAGGVISEPEGVYYCINPLSGSRKDDNVVDFRNGLVELEVPKADRAGMSDEEKEERCAEFYTALMSSGLPLRAVYTSGDASVHGLVAIDAKSASEFKERIEKVYEFSGAMPGLDRKNKNPSRLSRLPGALRGETLQALLHSKPGAKWSDWKPTYTEEVGEDLTQEMLERIYRDTDAENFPAPMKEEAFIGPLGKLVDYILPNTEAGREALLAQLLVAFGNSVNRTVWINAGGKHFCVEFAVIVGDTGVGRKGTGLRAIMDVFEQIDNDWVKRCEIRGVQSGEGIIHSVRDARYKRAEGKKEQERADEKGKICVDEGVEDKRKIIVSEEFAQVLAVAGRKDSTVTTTLREVWDCPIYLQNSAKNNGEVATEAHISMIAHTTRSEFKAKTHGTTDISNGMFNRLLFFASKRSKLLPDPKWIDWSCEADEITRPIKQAVQHARQQGEHRIRRDGEAAERWDVFYRQTNERLGKDTGLVAHALARIATHVARLSLIYATADCSHEVQLQHQLAAEAVVEYCERSARWLFGALTGDRMADKVIRYLRTRCANGSATRTQISESVFHRNVTSADLDRILAMAKGSGAVDFRIEKEGTVKREAWYFKS